MNKFLATLLAGAFSLTLGASAFAADAAKPVEAVKEATAEVKQEAKEATTAVKDAAQEVKEAVTAPAEDKK